MMVLAKIPMDITFLSVTDAHTHIHVQDVQKLGAIQHKISIVAAHDMP